MTRVLKPSISTLLVLILAISGFAQSYRLGFFINVAGSSPSNENIKSGLGTGLGAVFYVSQNIAVSVEWKYGRFNVDKKEGEFLKGSLYMTPILASFRYNIETGTALAPYVFGGGGIFFSNYRLDKLENLGEANVRKQDINDGLGLYGGIGSIYKLNEKLILFIEGLYLWRTADIKTTYIDNSPSNTFTTNLSSASILIGLNYFY
jgi:opacity protein-like surface antigen